MKDYVDNYISDEIYTPLPELTAELFRRRENSTLRRDVSSFFSKDFLEILGDEPRAILSRPIATPNMEMAHFLELASGLKLKPLILEFPDKFVAKNSEKYHLCKLSFIRERVGKNPILVDTLRIVNFNSEEGRNFADMKTTWGEGIINFHHRLLFEQYPTLRGSVSDFTGWFTHVRQLSKYYYMYYLSLFIRNGILFENFLPEDKEEAKFISKKFSPSFHAVIKQFGLQPLIFQLLPSRYCSNNRWYSYPEKMKQKILDLEHKEPFFEKTFPRLSIKNSNINLVGVFADEFIKKGTTIRVLSGEIISFDECIRRIRAGKERQRDSLQVGLELDMDLDDFSRSFNHSCDPNCGIRHASELVSIKDISKGEEITFDYSATIGPNIPSDVWESKCNCGAINCRESIGNVLKLPKEQLEKYLEADALQDYIINELELIRMNADKLPKYRRVEL